MAARPGSFFSAAESPPSHNDPLLHLPPAHDWELLSMSTMSSSTLLAHGHGLGLGFPHRSPANPPRFQRYTGGTEEEENDWEGRNAESSSDGSSLPLDVSQIAVMCSSTSSVEPFTEGWKPHFRIAGAPLQENYYPQDPFAAASNTGSFLEQSRHQSEPFLAMEQSFLKEPLQAMEEAFAPSQVEGEQGRLAPENTEKAGRLGKSEKLSQEEEDDEELLTTQEKAEKNTSAASKLAETGKACKKKASEAQGKHSWFKRRTFLYRKSHVVWSVALTATLLGVFFITHRFQADRHELLLELSTRDETWPERSHNTALKMAVT